jgi:hypothetical protein
MRGSPSWTQLAVRLCDLIVDCPDLHLSQEGGGWLVGLKKDTPGWTVTAIEDSGKVKLSAPGNDGDGLEEVMAPLWHDGGSTLMGGAHEEKEPTTAVALTLTETPYFVYTPCEQTELSPHEFIEILREYTRTFVWDGVDGCVG